MILNGNRTITAATSNNVTVSGIISQTGGAQNLIKAGGGLLSLSEPNTFTGTTSVDQGTLTVNSIADSGSSALGLGTQLNLGSGTSTAGVLIYESAGNPAATTSRTVNLAATTTGAGTTGAGTITNNSADAGASLSFTASTFLNAATSGAKIFTLSGTNTGANTFAGNISNGTGTLSFIKTSTGSWTLSGASNSYTGATTVNDGTLKLGANEVLPNASAVTISKGILEVNGKTETVLSLALGAATTTVAGITATVQDMATGGSLILGSNVTYNAGSVGFENGQATIAVDLNLGGVACTITTNNGEADDDLVISGAITNTGAGITFSNPGTVVLSNSANNYTATSIGGAAAAAGGTLKLGANSMLGTGFLSFDQRAAVTGTLDINGKKDTINGTLNLGGSNGVAGSATQIIDSAGGGLLSLGNNVNYSAGSGLTNGQATISANLDLNGATRTFTIADSTATTTDTVISGAIQGSAGLTKGGLGTLVLSGTNTYNGTTTVNASGGTLQLGNGGSTGSIANSASISVATGATLNTNRSDSLSLNQAITGAGNVEIANTSTGSTILGSNSNAYTGTTTVSGGTLLATRAAALPGYNAASKVSVASGATLAVRAGAVSGEWTSGEIDSVLGATTAAFTSGSKFGIDVTTGNSFTYANDIRATQAAKGFVKSGDGTLTLSSANTYSGGTTVSAGTLEVNNTSGSGTGSGTVTVNSTLAGEGSITTGAGNFVYINGTLLVGKLGATQGTDYSMTTSSGGSTILGSSSFTAFDLWSTTGTDQSSNLAAADMLRLFGDVSITSGATLKLNNPNALTFAAGDVFKLFDWVGLGTRTGDFGSNIDSSALNLGSLTLDTSNLYTAGTISILGIPEPSRALLLMLGLVGLVTRRRRR